MQFHKRDPVSAETLSKKEGGEAGKSVAVKREICPLPVQKQEVCSEESFPSL